MQTYLVSGASSGIGKAVTDYIINQGHNVIALSHSDNLTTNQQLSVLKMDFLNSSEVSKKIAAYKLPSIKAFINCAGTTHSKSIRETNADEIESIFRINLISPMMVIHSILPYLEDNSSIILLGSQSAYKGSFDDSYAASKGAIDSLVKSLSAKLAPKTRVINLAPGITYPTALTQIMPEELRQQKKKEIPMKRFATPEEIAEVIFFLTSDACRFMTGNTVDINGGLVLR